MSNPLEEILSLSQFQSTVEIHWDLIIAGESVGSAVCFKNPWCQSLIFLGETLISCIVPGNHGLFSGQQKNPAQNAVLPPPHICTRISAECSTPASGTTRGTHTLMWSIMRGGIRATHFPGTEAFSLLWQGSSFLSFYFLLQDECWWWKAVCKYRTGK